jgi:hypothetical protein
MGKQKDRKRKGGGQGRGGTMMSMRSGMRRLVGQEKGQRKKSSPFWNAVSWVVFIAAAGALIFLVVRRYF